MPRRFYGNVIMAYVRHSRHRCPHQHPRVGLAYIIMATTMVLPSSASGSQQNGGEQGICMYIYIHTHTHICVCDVILAQWRLKSPAIGLFVKQFLKADKKSKLRITGPLCLPVTSRFPAQMATDMWKNVMTSWWCIWTNINAPYRWPLFLGEIHLRPVVSHHKGQLIG